jgi:hypothetical protein
MPDTPPNPAELSSSAPALAEQPPIPTQPSESWENPQEQAPVLDVHPPHHAASTWRDFFIHIATIVIGLLIAVGLEQMVEYIHHRRELAETRTLLREEREANKKTFANLVLYWRGNTAALKNNLLVFQYLRDHPGTPEENLPGTLNWRHISTRFTTVAWDAAQLNGVAALMPREEAANYALLYRRLQQIRDTDTETFVAVLDAEEFTYADRDPSHLSAAQLADEIARVDKALSRSSATASYLSNMGGQYPDFPPSLTLEEVDQLRNLPDAATKIKLAKPAALTAERLKAAGVDAPMKMTPEGWAPVTSPSGAP